MKREAKTRCRPEPLKSYGFIKRSGEKQFVVRDENAAAHLVRNALGGGDEDLLRGMVGDSGLCVLMRHYQMR